MENKIVDLLAIWNSRIKSILSQSDQLLLVGKKNEAEALKQQASKIATCFGELSSVVEKPQWKIYALEREYAEFIGDKCFGVVGADTKEEAEKLAVEVGLLNNYLCSPLAVRKF